MQTEIEQLSILQEIFLKREELGPGKFGDDVGVYKQQPKEF
jgi:hypothetical protein